MITASHQDIGRDQGAVLAFALARERHRVADELHDTVIQQLVPARILTDQACEKGNTAPLDRVRWLLDDSLEQLRALILGLTPAVLHQAGLCAAIRWLSEHLGTRWRLAYRCRLLGEPAQLPDPVAEALFGGARELMNNAGRHARARVCDVVLTFGDDSVELTVSDDGIGIDATGAGDRIPDVDGGSGLFSLRSRIEELGGNLQLGPRDGGGTRATLKLRHYHPVDPDCSREKAVRGATMKATAGVDGPCGGGGPSRTPPRVRPASTEDH